MYKMWAIGPRNKINVQDKKIHNPVTNYYYNVMNIGSTVYSYLHCLSSTHIAALAQDIPDEAEL